MIEAVIAAAGRTPIGRAFKGSLAEERPEDLAVAAIRAAMSQAPGVDLDEVDDLLLGCGLPGAVSGNNLARVIAVMLGADRLPGVTLTRYCTSSIQTTRNAFHAIRAGEGRAFLSVGVESISSQRSASSDVVPGVETHHPAFTAAEARTVSRASDALRWTDPRESGELPDVYIPMGQTAENLAKLYGIDREAQDEFALRSQQRAAAASAAGRWQSEITPYTTVTGAILAADESPRPTTTLEGLGALSPVFRADGTVTAGNACPLNDGGAALLITSRDFAEERGLTPLARVVSSAVSGLSPEIMGLGPVESTRRALALAGMTLKDIDLIEINEAFAAQVLACIEELGVEEDRVNVSGGAIALGHPFGMTGARLTHTMIGNLVDHDASTGLITLCTAGGQGMTLVIERV